MTIKEIYTKFELMPTLQQHMVRVAAVGKMVCDNSPLPINQTDVVQACLFHDLGNIIKFDLTKFPEFLQPVGEEYWKGVQNEYFAKYGFDEHVATLMMLKQLNVKPDVYQLVKNIGFNEFMTKITLEKPWYELWVCEYADMRVTPTGVVSLEQRIEDLEERYGKKYHEPKHVENRRRFQEIMKRVEEKLFTDAELLPGDITEEKAQQMTSQLLKLHL